MLETPRWSHSATAVLLDFSPPGVPNILQNFSFSAIAVRISAPQDTGSRARKMWHLMGESCCSSAEHSAPTAFKACCQLHFFSPTSTESLTSVPADLKPESTAAFQWTCLSAMQEEILCYLDQVLFQ